MKKSIPVFIWEQIPDNEKTVNNEDFKYIVMDKLVNNGGREGYTYLIQGKNIYIAKGYNTNLRG